MPHSRLLAAEAAHRRADDAQAAAQAALAGAFYDSVGASVLAARASRWIN